MKRVMAQSEEHILAEHEHIPQEVTEEFKEEIEAKTEERNSIFPDEYMQPLKGLMFLGALEKEFEYGGHTFLLRTLREGEIMRIGQLMKDWRGTTTEIEARKCYTVAAAIVSVDGRPIRSSYKQGYDQIYENAHEVKQWYPAVIKFLYEKYIELEVSAISVSDALKK